MNTPARSPHRILMRAVILSLISASSLMALSAVEAADTSSVLPEDVQTMELIEPRRRDDSRSGYWAISFDNDLFAAGGNDQDYTGGFNITLAGGAPRKFAAPVRRVQEWLDDGIGVGKTTRPDSVSQPQQAVQFGLLIFTPRDINASGPLVDDRPYANLAYLSNSHFSLNWAQTVMIQSTLTIGLVGTGIAKEFQGVIHEVTDGDEPQGYAHQISKGGELTARYAVARHSLLASGSSRRTSYDVKLALEGSVGYLTEAAVGLGLRWGRINSPWWSSTSEYADYTSQPSPSAAYASPTVSKDRYFTAGLKIRARAYNTFLQGQFRDSDVTFASSDLHNLIAETWLGLTTEFNGLRVSYVIRHQTAELRNGAGARDHTWAGVTVARSFRK